jgi:hypothetical protein
MSADLDDLVNVVQRWESLGLLEGLPIQEKVELAQIYDNATRLALSEIKLRRVPKNVSDLMDEIFIPICRRLYKRVGTNFDITTMMSDLLESVNNNVVDLTKNNPNSVEDPIVKFCIDFADNYQDEITNVNNLTDEEYRKRVEVLLETMRSILLSDEFISNVDQDGDNFKLIQSSTKKTKNQVRYNNQYVAKNYLSGVLSGINKGN